MEEADFYEARFNLAALEKDCEDVCTPMVMIADADNVKEFWSKSDFTIYLFKCVYGRLALSTFVSSIDLATASQIVFEARLQL